MKNEIKKWIDVWQNAGSALEQIRRKNLQSPDYYNKNLRLLNEMLIIAFEKRTVRSNSGLVELQRIFRKGRYRSNSTQR